MRYLLLINFLILSTANTHCQNETKKLPQSISINKSIKLLYNQTVPCDSIEMTSLSIEYTDIETIEKEDTIKKPLWITWKQKYLTCEDESMVQIFYVPYNKQFIELDVKTTPIQETVFPPLIRNFKSFDGSPAEIKLIRLESKPSNKMYMPYSVESLKRIDQEKEVKKILKDVTQKRDEIAKIQESRKHKESLFIKECNSLIQPDNEFDRSELTKRFDALESQIAQSWKDLNKQNQELISKEKELNEKLTSINGEIELPLDNATLRIYIVDLKKEEINLFVKEEKVKTIVSNNFQGVLSGHHKSKSIRMMTNAGMFTPEFKPEGFYKDRFNCFYPLDTAKLPEKNFYMQPNGVFYIDESGKPYIETTSNFSKKFKTKDYKSVQIGTQSGPMLVYEENGKVKINPNFSKGSVNLNIRSGVGLVENGGTKVIFIVSTGGMNFYDFASIFKDWFGCKNALFLDGAISEIWTGPKDKSTLRSSFGPMFCITSKK